MARLELTRSNLLQMYCCLRHLNGKDKTIIYRQLIEIFGDSFISRWETLFEDSYNEQEEILLPTLNWEQLKKIAFINALKMSNFVQADAAKLLGMKSRMVNHYIGKYNIVHESWPKNNRKDEDKDEGECE